MVEVIPLFMPSASAGRTPDEGVGPEFGNPEASARVPPREFPNLPALADVCKTLSSHDFTGFRRPFRGLHPVCDDTGHSTLGSLRAYSVSSSLPHRGADFLRYCRLIGLWCDGRRSGANLRLSPHRRLFFKRQAGIGPGSSFPGRK